jgi:hypothetical protein
MTTRKVTATLAIALTLGGFGVPVRADYQLAQEILESGTLGGTRGLRVRRIGSGSAAFSRNGSFVYYPASSLKILEHYYAMSRVQAGAWTLAGTNAAVCPTDNDNCGPALNALSGCGSVVTPLDDTLSAMMKSSSNEATNAIQERVGTTYFPPVNPFILNMSGFGRLLINQFAQSIGMTNSGVNHKFGCVGFCGNPAPNALTLVDAERLYRSIATDTGVLSPGLRVELHDLMLNESGSFLDDIIDEEAASTGRNAWKEDFRDLFYQIRKAGSWTCSGKKYISLSGLVQLPTYNGANKQLYTWGVFAHDTESEFYLDGTDGNASRELLRLPIRAALLTWGLGYAVAEQVGGIGETIEQLPSSGSPAAPALHQAAAALRAASDVLERESRDYAAAFVLLRKGVDWLEYARRLDPELVSDQLTRRLLVAAHEGAVDVVALATMTSKAGVLTEAVDQMEIRIRRAQDIAGQGAFGAAVREYVAVAARGNPLIEWGNRGAAFSDHSVGFFGRPATSTEPPTTSEP